MRKLEQHQVSQVLLFLKARTLLVSEVWLMNKVWYFFKGFVSFRMCTLPPDLFKKPSNHLYLHCCWGSASPAMPVYCNAPFGKRVGARGWFADHVKHPKLSGSFLSSASFGLHFWFHPGFEGEKRGLLFLWLLHGRTHLVLPLWSHVDRKASKTPHF